MGSVLKNSFAARKPVIMNVGWVCSGGYTGCGGHAVTLAGTDGMGRYYLHDPLNRVNHYQALTWSEILTYSPQEFDYEGRPTSFVVPATALQGVTPTPSPSYWGDSRRRYYSPTPSP